MELPGFLSELGEQLLNTGRLINMFHHCVPDVSYFSDPTNVIVTAQLSLQNFKQIEEKTRGMGRASGGPIYEGMVS